jgi:hypothetical protein
MAIISITLSAHSTLVKWSSELSNRLILSERTETVDSDFDIASMKTVAYIRFGVEEQHLTASIRGVILDDHSTLRQLGMRSGDVLDIGVCGAPRHLKGRPCITPPRASKSKGEEEVTL